MHSFLLRLHYKIAHRQKNHTLALSYAEQIRAFFETAGDQKGIAESLVLKGNAHYHLSQSANAKQYAHAALEKARQIGDQEIIAAASGLLNMLSAPPAEDSTKTNEPSPEKNDCSVQKPPGILDVLDDIARDEESVRSYPVLGLVWSDIGGEDKFEIREERPGGPYVLTPTAPVPLTFYRGQVEWHNPCVPTLYRSKEKQKEKDNIEIFIDRLRAVEFELLLRDHPFVKEVFDNGVVINYQGQKNNVPLKVSYVELAQHYGLKTDMMDFTSDKWVAAFFATNQYTPGGYKPVNKGKRGIIYRYKPLPASPEKISDPHYSPGFETVGLQPFSRPGEQRAFALRLDKGENMNDKLHMQSRVFQHDLKAAKIIHSRMNQGNSLFPPDEMIPIANEINKSRKFSQNAFDLAWECHSIPGIDKEKVIHALRRKNIKICNHTLFQLPKDIARRFRQHWQNEGASRFYDKIVGRAGLVSDKLSRDSGGRKLHCSQ